MGSGGYTPPVMRLRGPDRYVLPCVLAALVAVGVATMRAASAPAAGAGEPVEWGVTFSVKQCRHLGLTWRDAYAATLADLRPSVVRLIAYWDLVEPRRGENDFRDLDEQVRRAEAAGAGVVICAGQKAPRWPEYHYPRWLDVDDRLERETRVMRYLETVVLRYRDTPGLRYWQVENEPFLPFGRGPKTDPTVLAREIALVRRLDPRHPVLVTDGGEWGWWVRAAEAGDVFGTTVYRDVYDRRVGPFTYPLTPGYYAAKTWLTKLAVGRPGERFICAELAAEPWGEKPVDRMTPAEQRALYPPSSLAASAAFARRAGFREAYFWGVEWWYLRRLEGDSSYWEAAESLMRRSPRPAVRPSER